MVKMSDKGILFAAALAAGLLFPQEILSNVVDGRVQAAFS